MHQQLWRYKVEEKFLLRLREQKRLNTTVVENCCVFATVSSSPDFYSRAINAVLGYIYIYIYVCVCVCVCVSE
jgi:hypothetical protein